MPIVSIQVKMLIERMDLYPDEFIVSNTWDEGKWDKILNNGGFNAIEMFLLKRKYRKIKRKATQNEIMTIIMSDNKRQGPVSSNFADETMIQISKNVRKYTPKKSWLSQ